MKSLVILALAFFLLFCVGESLGLSGCASTSAPKNVSAPNLPACNTSNLGVTNQFGAPSKLVASPSHTGPLKSEFLFIAIASYNWLLVELPLNGIRFKQCCNLQPKW